MAIEHTTSGTQLETSPLIIGMLGSFRVALGNQDLYPEAWELQKAAAVFKYLVCEEGRWVADDVLLDLFWPDAEPERGRKALRTTIYHLRRYLEPTLEPYGSSAFVAARRRAYRFRIETPHRWDVGEFLGLSDEAIRAHETKHPQKVCSLLRRALALFAGEFLPEDYYEEWTALWRERLRLRYLEAVAYLSWCVRAMEPGAADVVRHLELAVARSPEREDLARELMWHLAASGNSVAALKHYETLSRRLRDEFGGEPSELTRAFAEHLRAGRGPNGEDRVVTVRRLGSGSGAATAEGPVSEVVTGALMLDWPSFRQVVEWERARVSRSGQQGSVVLVTIDPTQKQLLSWEELLAEMEGVWHLAPDKPRMPHDDRRAAAPTPWQIGIAKELRNSDALCPLDTQRLVILLPETDARSANLALERFLTAAAQWSSQEGGVERAGSGAFNMFTKSILPLTSDTLARVKRPQGQVHDRPSR